MRPFTIVSVLFAVAGVIAAPVAPRQLLEALNGLAKTLSNDLDHDTSIGSVDETESLGTGPETQSFGPGRLV